MDVKYSVQLSAYADRVTGACAVEQSKTNNGKMKTGITCYLTADILTKVLQTFSLSSPQSKI